MRLALDADFERFAFYSRFLLGVPLLGSAPLIVLGVRLQSSCLMALVPLSSLAVGTALMFAVGQASAGAVTRLTRPMGERSRRIWSTRVALFNVVVLLWLMCRAGPPGLESCVRFAQQVTPDLEFWLIFAVQVWWMILTPVSLGLALGRGRRQ